SARRVLGLGDRLEVVRVHASRVLADVVDLVARRDLPLVASIREPVRPVVPQLTGLAWVVALAVAVGIDVPVPFPAPGLGDGVVLGDVGAVRVLAASVAESRGGVPREALAASRDRLSAGLAVADDLFLGHGRSAPSRVTR